MSSRFVSSYSRRQFLKTSLAALSSTSLAGCGWTLAEVRSDRPQTSNSNELRIYTWSNYIDETLLKEFTAQTGVRVIADTYDSNDVMLATFQAGKGVAYSVVYPSDYAIAKMLDLKLLAALDKSRISGLENILGKFQNSIYDPGNRHHVPVSWGTTGLIYNSEKLNPAPEDWDYLWQNRNTLSRKMTLLSEPREVLGASLRAQGFSYNTTNPTELKKAYEKLADLKPAIATFTTDAWRDQLLAGDLLLAMGYSIDGVLVAQENPNMKYVVPKSGSSLWTDAMVIPKTAPNPEAAYAWINYMLQPAVAAQVTERLFFATPNQAAFDQLSTDLRDNQALFPPDSVVERCENLKPLPQKSEELIEKYWTKLTSS